MYTQMLPKTSCSKTRCYDSRAASECFKCGPIQTTTQKGVSEEGEASGVSQNKQAAGFSVATGLQPLLNDFGDQHAYVCQRCSDVLTGTSKRALRHGGEILHLNDDDFLKLKLPGKNDVLCPTEQFEVEDFLGGDKRKAVVRANTRKEYCSPKLLDFVSEALHAIHTGDKEFEPSLADEMNMKSMLLDGASDHSMLRQSITAFVMLESTKKQGVFEEPAAFLSVRFSTNKMVIDLQAQESPTLDGERESTARERAIAYINLVYVKPEFRNQELFEKMFMFVQKQALALGVVYMGLYAREDNIRIRKAAKRVGMFVNRTPPESPSFNAAFAKPIPVDSAFVKHCV